VRKHQSSLLYDYKNIFFIYCYLASLLLLLLNLPKTINLYLNQRHALIGLALLGTWRYSWWLIHVLRSLIYAKIIFPRNRQQADLLWSCGIKPKRLFFLMTTYKELPETTHKVLASIVSEVLALAIPAFLFIGIGDEEDAVIINDFFQTQALNEQLTIILVRQKLPGKRYAIGETLRVLVNHGLEKDEPVIFMDGDTYFMPGCLAKSLSFFSLFPNLQALTTNEQAIVHGAPSWMEKWLAMRFAQRHFTMQSYALSNKILTLTGRMSIFRGKHLLEKGFIDIIENDHLQHWLWGKFRFLSGDDKSTWYYLLKAKAHMTYIPDAMTTTIEYIQGNALFRMKENLRRWSGNTLRNGARALALGPKRVGFFIWWCILDQRLAIWTMPAGLMIILLLAYTKASSLLLINLIWIAFSRLCLSCVLFYHYRRIDMSYPFLIYINQMLTSFIKIYIIFRLSQQRWQNRGNQQAGFNREAHLPWRDWVANYLIIFYMSSLFLLVLIYLHLLNLPTYADLAIIFTRLP
jgi:mannuronan synthase